MTRLLAAATEEERDHVPEERDDRGEEHERGDDVLIGVQLRLDHPGLVEDGRGHQENHQFSRSRNRREDGNQDCPVRQKARAEFAAGDAQIE